MELLTPDRVITGAGNEVIEGGAVLVDGSGILAVGPAAQLRSRLEAAGASVRDLPGQTLLPGLIDCHVHLGFDASEAPVAHMMAASDHQLLVEMLEPQGLGALQLAFEQLKKKLSAEGLFAAQRKRPLPRFPRRIGIVTSPRGAAIADMIQILSRRFPGLHIRLFPALVRQPLRDGESGHPGLGLQSVHHHGERSPSAWRLGDGHRL